VPKAVARAPFVRPKKATSNAEASIKEYIEIFYNRQRRHSRLDYVSPATFADNFKKLALSA